MTKGTNFKIIRGSWNNGEYKYNVQIIHNGVYCGHGRFCKTYNEAIQYANKEIREANGVRHFDHALRRETR